MACLNGQEVLPLLRPQLAYPSVCLPLFVQFSVAPPISILVHPSVVLHVSGSEQEWFVPPPRWDWWSKSYDAYYSEILSL